MNQQIMNILNPVRPLKVDDFYDIASKNVKEKLGGYLEPSTYQIRLFQEFLKVQRNWESLLSLKLDKGMFVCEKPEYTKNSDVNNALEKQYTEAQSQVLFAGFETEGERVIIHNSGTILTFEKTFVTIRFKYDNFITLPDCTVADIIYLISRHNRTAQTPIHISWTPNILNKLLK